jgi:LDH2 family malate/lactate/ureidoglycolate dehydrogenase
MDGGIGLALIVGLIAGLILGWSTAYQGRIEGCEQNLTRSQQCILIAVPEVENDMPNMQER